MGIYTGSSIMTDGPLIVPVITPCGTVHFASVPQNATAEDVVRALLEEGVSEEVLGDLSDEGWDLQVVRQEPSGRVWEEDELEALDDGESDHSLPCETNK